MKKKVKIWQNPIRWYLQTVKDSVEPTTLSHRIRMNIDIKKGATKGRALIPCAIYSYDHSIDLNPALIRRKDKKVIKQLPVNKNISYDSNKFDVQLTKNEKKLGYTLNEIEKCKHCGQKLVIAEIAETRYRSCPDIKVRVASKAKEDLKIPVDFGINRSDVIYGMTAWIVLDLITVFLVFSMITGFSLATPLNNFFSSMPSTVMKTICWVLIGFMGLMWFVAISRIHYKAFRLWKWWNEVKHTVTKTRVAN